VNSNQSIYIHLSCLSGGSSPGSNPGNSGNAGPPVVTQAADATSATSSASVVRSGVNSNTTAAGCVGIIQQPLFYLINFLGVQHRSCHPLRPSRGLRERLRLLPPVTPLPTHPAPSAASASVDSGSRVSWDWLARCSCTFEWRLGGFPFSGLHSIIRLSD